MTVPVANPLNTVIACGGTGGHLFPGLAVGRELLRRDCRVRLLVSTKDIDREAARCAEGMVVDTLPAVGLQAGRRLAFLNGFIRSYHAARRLFRSHPPDLVLAMGGFTSAPPVLAGRRAGARTFVHESNTIPGRANRWLARVVDQSFVGFPSARSRLRGIVTVTGTPVRSGFSNLDGPACCQALGLDPSRPVLAVLGGSQGARGVNHLICQALDDFKNLIPGLQFVHLTGAADVETVRGAYQRASLNARIHPFFDRMDLVLGAATVAVSRSGASTLAELAAARVIPVLVPFPAATDNHQYYNATAYTETGAACLLEQATAQPRELASLVSGLIKNTSLSEHMRSALGAWHEPGAAGRIVDLMLAEVARARHGKPAANPFRTPPSAIDAPGFRAATPEAGT